MIKNTLLPFRFHSAGGLFAAPIVLVVGLSGCGFKSDLTVPDSSSENPLFVPDKTPSVEAEQIPPYLPSSIPTSETEGVEVDIATAVATEGEILVSSPVGEETAEGVPVDISDVGIELNDQVEGDNN